MGRKEWELPSWISYWFVIAGLICIWDGSFVLTRPESFAGGKYDIFYIPYRLYVQVDYVYGTVLPFGGWVVTQTYVNLVEVFISFLAVYLSGKSPLSFLLAMIVSATTISKTVLYFLLEHCSGYENIGHNDFGTLMALYIIPNVLWIIVPFFINIWCVKEVYGRLMQKKKDE